MPTVWLQAVIVVCAYVGYKATDDFSLLAHDALGFDDAKAVARLMRQRDDVKTEG